MARTSESDLTERELKVLIYLYKSADTTTQRVAVSMRTMANHLSLSENRLRHTLKTLVKQNEIARHERYLENGARIEDEFSVSPAGMRRLLGAYLSKTQEEDDSIPVEIPPTK